MVCGQRERRARTRRRSAASRCTRATPAPRTAAPSASRRWLRRPRRIRPRTSRRPAGPAGRSRSTSTRTGSRTRRSRPRRSFPTYEEVRTAVRNAFAAVTDPANPGKQVVLKIMNKEELRNVDGSDSLHPNRSGDVVVVLRPPYQSDAGHAEPGDRAVALLRAARLPAGHGRPEEQRQHARDVRRWAARRSKHKDNVEGPAGDRRRADDRVPDGHARPDERPRADPLRPRREHQGPPRGDDPRHQRLPRAADPAGRGVRRQLATGAAFGPAFTIGGSAFLKKWFEVYEGEAALDRQARGRDRDGRRRLRRRDAADLELLRRQADDRPHEPDGHRHRRAGQPQLRCGPAVPARSS